MELDLQIELLKNIFQSNINSLWIITCSLLVFVMQAGFMCLESGLSRPKNTINTALKSLVAFGLAVSVFWAVGFGLMFGKSLNGFIGTDKFFFSTDFAAYQIYFVYQCMFCATAATITSGAVAERLKFEGYIIIVLLVAGILYPIVGHWAWVSNYLADTMDLGFLTRVGFYDFAGGTIVHSLGGWVALSAILILGPRIGRFSKENINKNLASSYPLAILGTIILWFGWFGFNGGSHGKFDFDLPSIIINTFMGGSAGLIGGIIMSYILEKNIIPRYLLIGPLAGLVSITPCANIISQESAILIGFVGSVLGIFTEKTLIRFKIDDVVSAVPVHLTPGIWGTLAAACFADFKLLEEMTMITIVPSRYDLIVSQLYGIFAVGTFVFSISFITLYLINKIYPLRVSALKEELGLNIGIHNAGEIFQDLINTMKDQSSSGDLSLRVSQDRFTNAGIIGTYYNRLLSNLEDAQKEKEKWRARVAQEINLASEVQSSFNPKRDLTKYPVGAYNVPARELSGDFYAFYPKNEKIYFTISDVSGKGMNAAMVMAKTITLFDTFAQNGYAIQEMAFQMNNDLFSTKTRGMFVTSIIGEYQLETDEVTWINCGHISPLIRNTKTNKYETVLEEESTQPLGLLNQKHNAHYLLNTISLKNRRIYFFTDGLTESSNSLGEEIGIEGVKDLILKKKNSILSKEVKDIVTEVTISQGIDSFDWSTGQHSSKGLKDDITVLSIGK